VSTEPVETTEIIVSGANCPWCLRETLDQLRREPGVEAVTSSTVGQCIEVRHRGVGTGRLLSVIREHLHGDGMSSNERVMVEVDPQVAALHCRHQGGASR
jgi:hypothetical protein